MTPDRRAVCDRVLGYAALVDAACASRELDRWLVLALIATESAGDPCAVRCEPAFWDRYKTGIIADLAKAGMAKWARFPDLVSASYGLCQVMFPVSLERGMVLAYPTSLCEPATGIEAGCRQLRWLADHLLRDTTESIRTVLLRFNGGADRSYPDRVLGWQDDIQAAARG